MNDQLNLNGDPVPTCTGCGLPLPDDNGPMLRVYSHKKCRTCRANDGEETKECAGCYAEHLDGDMWHEAYFYSPWDDEPTDTDCAYCETCVDRGLLDEGTFMCDGCYRQISEDNGRMYYYRRIDDYDILCLRCIENDLKSGGIAAISHETLRAVTEKGKPFGMFFNVGELEAEGWEPVPGWDNTRFGEERCEELAKVTSDLHNRGMLFIIGYERLSIVGDEGYITLYTKENASEV